MRNNKMMMKNIKIIFILITSFLILNSCKKGEDDPFFTLLSRKTRITGEWKLKSADYERTYPGLDSIGNLINIKRHYLYSDSKYTITYTYSGNTDVTEYVYTEDFKINRDGTYIVYFKKDTLQYTEEGNWIWMNKNSELELKNKEAILLFVTKTIDSWGTQTNSGKSMYPDDMMVLRKLTNNEFVIEFDYSDEDENGFRNTQIGTMTYIQD